MFPARAFTLALALIVPSLSTSDAQTPPRLSVDASAGRSVGWTRGEYRNNRSGIAADLLLGARLGHATGSAIIAAIGAGAYGSGGHTTDCRPSSTGGCVRAFPSFFTFAPLVGWESAGGRFRMLGGPAWVNASDHDRALGLQGRIDLATGPMRRLAAIASLRPALIPDHRGDVVGLLSFGVGLRFR